MKQIDANNEERFEKLYRNFQKNLSKVDAQVQHCTEILIDLSENKNNDYSIALANESMKQEVKTSCELPWTSTKDIVESVKDPKKCKAIVAFIEMNVLKNASYIGSVCRALLHPDIYLRCYNGSSL